MISYRQADLLETLNDTEISFDVLFCFEDNRVQLVSAHPTDKSVEMSPLVARKRDDLLAMIKDATRVMGFYDSNKDGLWSYNTYSNPTKVVMSIGERLNGYNPTRIIGVRDSLATNPSYSRILLTGRIK